MGLTRRDFLCRSAITAIGFSLAGVRTGRAASPGRVVVMIDLDGGNDGLNTVVPLAEYDLYRRRRRTLAVDRDRALRLPDAPELGLNPWMTSLRDLYGRGKVAVIAGVGAPLDAVGLFDHQVSQHMIQTGDVVDPDSPTGWLGRYLDIAGDGLLAGGVDLGGGRRILEGDGRLVTSGDRREVLTARTLADVEIVLTEDANALHAAYDRLTRTPYTPGGIGERNRVLRRELISQAAIINERTASYVAAADYPTRDENPLAASLLECAKLISAEAGVRALSVGFNGFDTHASQNDGGGPGSPGFHDFLVQSVSDAIGAFYADLEAHGYADSVVMVVLSEFGRRPEENSHAGTDHGLGSVGFVVGGAVRGGVYGTYPSLADERLVLDGNLDVTTDFRSVYATVLERFLDTDPRAVLGSSFPALGFL